MSVNIFKNKFAVGSARLLLLAVLLLWLTGCGRGSVQEYIHQLPEGTPTGGFVGQIRDAVSGEPLAGVGVTLVRNGADVVSGLSSENGLYQFRVKANTEYSLRFQANGYLDEEYHQIVVSEDELKPLETVRQIKIEYSGNDTAMLGSVHSARGDQPVSGVTLSLRRGINNRRGDVVVSSNSDAEGGYLFGGVASGSYTLELQGDQYSSAFYTLVAVSGSVSPVRDLAISSDDLTQGQARIVLSWDGPQRDLDVYLSGPQPETNQRFMIFYSQYNSDDADVVLLKSEALEGIEIRQQHEGSYVFAVEDYHAKNDGSPSHGKVAAKVELYRSDRRHDVFYAPVISKGICWKVFALEGEQLQILNELSDQLCKDTL